MKLLRTTLAAAAACLIFSTSARAANDQGFVTLFDGKTFTGWKLVNQHGRGYGIKDGILFCERGGGGNLFTEKEYENFIFRFEFRLESGSNNGIGIRAPLEGDAAYKAMEIQVLDDTTTKYGPLRPEQMHGSIYGVVGAKTGFQKPLGEWNEEEIIADGRHIKVVLNGHTIVDANLNDVSDAKIIQQHPGFLRDRGHIGFLGHTEFAEFRNIRIKELPSKNKDNKAPEGFTALFNGKNLNGWKGAVENPHSADAEMRKHWKVKNGVLTFDGKGKNLVSAKDYRDFEMLVDWKISPDSNSGIFLRGCPKVQIWDPNSNQSVGSGALSNNEKNPSKPLKRADKPIGEWNRFRIVMTGDRVTVYLNEQLVVDNVVMENAVEKGQPIYAIGPVELQSDNTPLWFKNIYIRELNTAKK